MRQTNLSHDPDRLVIKALCQQLRCERRDLPQRVDSLLADLEHEKAEYKRLTGKEWRSKTEMEAKP